MNFPNRELLLFRVVLALPKASKMGLAFRIFCSKVPPAEVPKLSHKYLRMYFVDSVFPAPDSPAKISVHYVLVYPNIPSKIQVERSFLSNDYRVVINMSWARILKKLGLRLLRVEFT